MDELFESILTNLADELSKVKTTPRLSFVNPTFISQNNKWFYEVVDGKIVKDFAKDEEALNWAAFWSENKDKSDFLYPYMVNEWMTFWWTDSATFMEWMTQSRNIDHRKAVNIMKWRNFLIDKGGDENFKGTHQVYVLYCPKHAHKHLMRMFNKQKFEHITVCVINGDETTSDCAEPKINGHIDAWERTNPSSSDKFIILMDKLGNRSLSVDRITYSIITGNSISYSAFDQKSARVRTANGDKSACVLDMTLSKEGYSFNAKVLMDHYIEENKKLGKTITEREAFDEFKNGTNILKYACEADERGLFSQMFTYSDYTEYVHRIILNRTLSSEALAIMNHLDDYNSLALKTAAEKVIAYIGGANNIKTNLSVKTSEGVKGDFRENDEADSKENDSKKNTNTADNTVKQEVDNVYKLVASIHESLYKYPMCLVTPVEGEDHEKPLVARWEDKKDYFINAYSTKYGTEVKKILEILMAANSWNSDWNEMIIRKTDHQNKLFAEAN